MQELWVKKTIYRRYLIEDSEIEEALEILNNEPERAEELIGDHYDTNDEVEYDEESIVLPVIYSHSAVANES